MMALPSGLEELSVAISTTLRGTSFIFLEVTSEINAATYRTVSTGTVTCRCLNHHFNYLVLNPKRVFHHIYKMFLCCVVCTVKLERLRFGYPLQDVERLSVSLLGSNFSALDQGCDVMGRSENLSVPTTPYVCLVVQ